MMSIDKTLENSFGFPSVAECGVRNEWEIEPMPATLINDPLDFIFAEHHRQRQAAVILMMIADGEFHAPGVNRLIEFLEGDFALHVGDEELGFFPILKTRCLPEDNIDVLIDRLKGEHKKDEQVGDEILAILKSRAGGNRIDLKDARLLRNFAEHIRQHLAVENAVLLPIARVRMNRKSLEQFSLILKERRSIQ